MNKKIFIAIGLVSCLLSSSAAFASGSNGEILRFKAGHPATNDIRTLKTGMVNLIEEGQEFKVILEENPSTGYSWSYKTSSDNVKLISDQAKKGKNMVGSPSQRVWTFKANQKGTYKLEFLYTQPWEIATAASKTVEYVIEVNSTSNIPTLTAGKVNKIEEGREFNVILDQNDSTGYQWDFKASSESIQKISDQVKKGKNMPGAPSQKVWTFKANQSGTYKLQFFYTPAWEKGTSALKTVEYTIEVNPVGNMPVLTAGKVNKIKEGQEFNVILDQNDSTGYEWDYKTSNESVQKISNYIKTGKNIVGSPSQKVWTFKANQKGTYKLHFFYAQLWEKNASALKSVEYTIEVG
ncbi:protease inhibitor I42 family protein [Paenibacillus tyrfis]|uniref:protease inhibitor I42 family protein n=1 Tax=Paenibacillus tyrfis TaxID=1501230 RepID=UPI00209FDDAC|nr:protease inhibitor I42 family protein [Paenibacillus tyrfis]MCP1311601.1 protease inhibitor I42 family protein [Paenibacillus tyrfis]